MDDEEHWRLAESAGAGDEAAFVKLYRLFGGPLLEFVLSILGCAQRDGISAEDVVQESMLRFWMGLGVFHDSKGPPVGGYLFRIARNVVIDHLRKHGQAATVFLEADPSTGIRHTAISNWNSADELERQEQLLALKIALQKLTKAERTAVTMHYTGGFSRHQIAVFLGRKDGAVKGLLERARAKLRESPHLHRLVNELEES